MKTIVTKHDELVRKYIQQRYQEETKKNLRTMLKTKQGRWFFYVYIGDEWIRG